ncbi:MAG: DUF5683 domain-containing protein [Ignavibacteriales bacterium]|nr:DUF5683 domain-containing protein [Ignavibacteriales bacterium]
MKYRILITGLLALFITTISLSQYLHLPTYKSSKTFLTGNLQNDFVMQENQMKDIDGSDSNGNLVAKNKYFPLAAGLFSAVIPGVGQFYTKSYWQSAAFFGAEVLTWVIYAAYEKKGDRQTDAFQNYADEHWSVVQYADWININFGRTININQDLSLHSWERVNWDELNTVEEQIAQTDPPTGFTHKLAPYSDQQYYEMIGKYSQFGGGWDDATAYTKADVIANNGIGNVSPRFIEYSNMRGEANSFYNIATTVSYVIVANHVFSALEAALNASKINHRIQLQGHVQSRRIYGNLIEFVPTLQVKYEL